MNEPRPTMPNRPSDSTLAALPARVLKFLFVIATKAPIRAQMQQGGFRFEDHAEGMALVNAVCECRDRSVGGTSQARALAAIAEIHQWVTTQFRRYRLAMRRLHPDAAGLFPETDSRYPMESLLAMLHLTSRLQQGAERTCGRLSI